MIEKIKKRKENNFSISYAEQNHRKKGKDKNKRKNNNNSFKNFEYSDTNPLLDTFYSNSQDDVKEIRKKISEGEEVKLFDIETVKKVLNKKDLSNKIGSYYFKDLILEILVYFDNKKVFLIRKD